MLRSHNARTRPRTGRLRSIPAMLHMDGLQIYGFFSIWTLLVFVLPVFLGWCGEPWYVCLLLENARALCVWTCLDPHSFVPELTCGDGTKPEERPADVMITWGNPQFVAVTGRIGPPSKLAHAPDIYLDPPVGVSGLDCPTLPIGFHWAPLGGSWYVYRLLELGHLM